MTGRPTSRRLVIIFAVVFVVAAVAASYSIGRDRGGIHCSGIYTSPHAAAILNADAGGTTVLDAANRVKPGCFTKIVPLTGTAP